MAEPLHPARVLARPATASGSDDQLALVDRPRLVEHLHRAVQGPLTVLTAPAGFGKSVLLRQWAPRHTGTPLASVALRPDVDAPRVAFELLAAAATLGADVTAAMPGLPAGPGARLGAPFLGALGRLLGTVGDAVLVIDALDAPHDAALARDLGHLVEHAPRNLHVVVSRRSRWPLTLHRLRQQGGVSHLDARELALTAEEAGALVQQVAGDVLTDDELAALLARTEGWALAVKVAATALRGGGRVGDVIEGLGAERQLAAFLREEVLDRQPARVRRFLLRTSVLDSLTAPLCGAVAGDTASAMLLRYIADRSTFIRRTHPGSERFLHQALFREVLRHELRVSEPEAETDLLVRAADWHLAGGEPERAAPYLVEAEQWDRLIDLVDRFAATLFERGSPHEVLRWLESVPVGADHRRTVVGLRRAYVLTMVGERRRAEQLLRELDDLERSPADEIAANVLRATWAFIDASPDSVLQAADAVTEALRQHPDDTLPDLFGMTSRRDLEVMAAGSRARALWYVGDVEASRAALTELATRDGVYAPWRVHVLSALALLEAWAGDLRVAQHHARQALASATTAGLLDHPATLDADHALAHVRRELGDLDLADTLLERARAVAVRTHRPVSLAIHTVERALSDLAAAQPERGLAELRAHEASGETPPPPIVDAQLRAVEVRLLLALGDTELAELAVDAAPNPLPPPLVAAAVQTAIARGDVDTAQEQIDGWPVVDARTRVERALWAAVVDLERGARQPALQQASAVVAEARALGLVRLFVDAGPAAERLLRALLDAEPSPYLSELVRSAEWTEARIVQGPAGLSRRELEVVRYLPTPLSSAEIASHLYISLNTLKTHLRTIYRKLGVSSRRDAARRAQELGVA